MPVSDVVEVAFQAREPDSLTSPSAEIFTYSGEAHFCPSAPNVIHLFSFSKVLRAAHITRSAFIMTLY